MFSDLGESNVPGDVDSYSCDDGDYVSGISYEMTSFEDVYTDGALDGALYAITGIGVICSSRDLGGGCCVFVWYHNPHSCPCLSYLPTIGHLASIEVCEHAFPQSSRWRSHSMFSVYFPNLA